MEGAPENIHIDDLPVAIRNTSDVRSIYGLHVWTTTSNINALSCHIVVGDSMAVAESEQIAHRVEHELSYKSIGHCTIQIESERHPHKNEILCSSYVEIHHSHSH